MGSLTGAEVRPLENHISGMLVMKLVNEIGAIAEKVTQRQKAGFS